LARLPVPPLLVISDRRQATHPLLAIAEAAFAGGCRWFSLRERDLPPPERRELLGSLVALGRRFAATVMMHEDIDAATDLGAGGVHLPSGSNPATARARLPHVLIGASAHTAVEASASLGAGADYVTVSPVFLTASKPGYGPALGLEDLARIVAHASGPIVALGGITAENAGLCLSGGAQGVAVMGEIMRAADPQATTEGIISAISGNQRFRRGRC
jgi:thiamine-phosphate pyrophosphorylase